MKKIISLFALFVATLPLLTINGMKGDITNGNWVEDSIVMSGSIGIKANPSPLGKNGTGKLHEKF